MTDSPTSTQNAVRVSHLEYRTDALEKEVTSLRESQVVFGNTLTVIQNTLLQIKYAIYGGGVVVAVQSLGLKEILIRMLHI